MDYFKWCGRFHDDLVELYCIFQQDTSLPVKHIHFETFKEYIYTQSGKYTV